MSRLPSLPPGISVAFFTSFLNFPPPPLLSSLPPPLSHPPPSPCLHLNCLCHSSLLLFLSSLPDVFFCGFFFFFAGSVFCIYFLSFSLMFLCHYLIFISYLFFSRSIPIVKVNYKYWKKKRKEEGKQKKKKKTGQLKKMNKNKTN